MTIEEAITNFGELSEFDAKPVIGNDVLFPSASQAGLAIGETRQLVQKWCNNEKYGNWNYVSIKAYENLMEKYMKNNKN